MIWALACVATCQFGNIMAEQDERETLYDRNLRRLQYEREEPDYYRGYCQYPQGACPPCQTRSRYYEHNKHYNYHDYYSDPYSRAVEEPDTYPE